MNIMDNLTFGIPKKEKKGKAWDFCNEKPTIKIEKDRGIGKPKGVYFNKKAHDLLFGESSAVKKLGIDFGLTDGIVKFANVNTLDVEFNKITKNPPYKFSNAIVYTHLCKSLKINSEIDNFFELSPITTLDFASAQLVAPNNSTTHHADVVTEEVVDTINITTTPELVTETVPTVLSDVDQASW